MKLQRGIEIRGLDGQRGQAAICHWTELQPNPPQARKAGDFSQSFIGDSLPSQVKAPDAVPPPPPGNVWVIPVKGALEVHWIPSEGKVEGYHVYRREGKEIIRLTATPVQKPPYVDSTVRKNVVYAYAVSAVGNQAGKREGLLSKWAEMRSLMIDQ